MLKTLLLPYVSTNLSNIFLTLILMINDIYPESSTHAKMVFKEVLHKKKLEMLILGEEGKPEKPEKPTTNLIHIWPQV